MRHHARIAAALAAVALLAASFVAAAPAAADDPLRTHAAARGKFIGYAAATGPLANEAAYRTIARRRVQPGHRRERDEVGRHRAVRRPVQLRRRRPGRRRSRSRPTTSRCTATRWSGTARRRAGCRASARPRCAPRCRTTSPRSSAATPTTRPSSRGTWSTRCSTTTAAAVSLLVQHARAELHRRRVPLRPRGRPRRAAVHQRLQRRGHQREEHRDVQPGADAAGAGRAGRLRRVPGPPGDPVRLPGPDAAEHAAVRRPRRAGADHRARRPDAAARATPPRTPRRHRTTARWSRRASRSPACAGVTIWGFTDRYSWVPDTFPSEGAALLYDANYAPKPRVHGGARHPGRRLRSRAVAVRVALGSLPVALRVAVAVAGRWLVPGRATRSTRGAARPASRPAWSSPTPARRR